MQKITIEIRDEEYEIYKTITEQWNKNRPGWTDICSIDGTIRKLAITQAFKELEKLGIQSEVEA